MCGINGYIQFVELMEEQKIISTINAMNDAIIHRGPDEDGIFADTKVGLGMRRLSIIDLATGSQPIYNENKTMVIVFNGEIYNFQYIKKILLEKGHRFTTFSDTEVVLHAYEEYGAACLQHFDGMFAFAIYDMKKRDVFIARDRVGEKPLYYSADSKLIIFGSELKSLLRTQLINKKIDKTALNQYLQLTYIPAPLTIFESVYKLEPGHYMTINLDGEISIQQYWDVQYNNDCLIENYDECKKKLRESLFSSVERRMISDVPIGAFLSGGIDSTTIVGIMASISSKPIDTFTIGFHEKEYDESNRAQLVADKYRTNHHLHYLDYNTALQELRVILDSIDEPFADSSIIPTYMVSKYAKQYVKVVLTGDAGDELFGGYSKYLISYYSDKYNRLPKFLRKHLFEKIVYAIPDNSALTRKMLKVIENAGKDSYLQRRDLMCLGFKDSELDYLLKDSFKIRDGISFIKKYYDKYLNLTDEISRTLYTDIHVVLEGDMLAKVDRMSMLNSIETRVPVLDKEVIELASRIPSNFKIHRRNLKIILKDTFSDLIPRELLAATKSGFSVPIDIWFKEPLKDQLLELLDRQYIEEQGLFNYDYVQLLLEEHFSNKRNRKSELWALFVFQWWYRRYILNS